MTPINTFFLRVAARCNLCCDYCYVFRHRDMSWKKLPAHMDISTVQLFADRLKEYLCETKINEVNIIYHGGEPLIIGADKIIEFSDLITSVIGNTAKVNFSLQTNGTLLSKSFLEQCKERNIGISLSCDGHKEVHDKHRKYLSGAGSFDDVLSSTKLLQEYPSIFEGIIGVIDPKYNPDEILEFFDSNGLHIVDMLLPDSTYQDLPVGRSENPNLYAEWLCNAFDSWFFKHQSISFRTFEHILKGIMGVESSLDSFGLGELDYLTIETDGSYHTTDILKSAYENASALNLTLEKASITTALSHDKIAEYNRLLSWDCLPQICKDCCYGGICGGGSLPHRFSPENGFNNPTVYCEEMKSLIRHAEQVLKQALKKKMLMETKHNIRIKKDLLPKDDIETEELLHEYFTDFQVKATADKEDWCVELIPENFTYCEEFSPSTTSLRVLPSKYNSFQFFNHNQGMCLSDAWTPYAWSKYLCKSGTPEMLTVIHIDDHSDLMSPFVIQSGNRHFDMITKKALNWNNPESIKSAVLSGAITIGSMMTPVVMSADRVNVIHLKQQTQTKKRCLTKGSTVDSILLPGAKRIVINKDSPYSSPMQNCYLLTSEYNLIHEHILQDSTVILHIDMDYFNNRYNGSTSWKTDRISFNPDFAHQKREIENLCSELSIVNSIVQIACVYIAISPSFYPCEFWKDGLSYLLENLEKASIDVCFLKSILDQHF